MLWQITSGLLQYKEVDNAFIMDTFADLAMTKWGRSPEPPARARLLIRPHQLRAEIQSTSRMCPQSHYTDEGPLIRPEVMDDAIRQVFEGSTGAVKSQLFDHTYKTLTGAVGEGFGKLTRQSQL